MNYTSIEQSKHLLELGLEPETADMCYEYQTDRWVGEPDYKDYPVPTHATHKKDIPCWSVGQLLESMPKTVNWKYLNIFTNGGDFCIEYCNPNGKPLVIKKSESLIEVCYETVCWLLQNNYIKTE